MMSRGRWLLLLSLSWLWLGSPLARAGVIWTSEALLKDMFSTADRVTYLQFDLNPTQKAEFKKRLGYDAPRTRYTFFVAYGAPSEGSPVVGYALFDQQQGQHQPIDFAVQFDTRGLVVRQEVVVYREAWGEEIRNPRFRAQFQGKSSQSPLRVGDDITIVSGATISSRAMAIGVKRGCVLWDLLISSSTPGVSP